MRLSTAQVAPHPLLLRGLCRGGRPEAPRRRGAVARHQRRRAARSRHARGAPARALAPWSELYIVELSINHWVNRYMLFM